MKMAKKDTSSDDSPTPKASKKPAESLPPDAATVETKEAQKEPKKEKTPKEKKAPKKRAKLTVLQAAVLETIRERPQRPRAIQTIIRGIGGVEVPRNEIIRSLNELKGKGLVDKVTTKAWQAK